jgi:hypothetical protein
MTKLQIRAFLFQLGCFAILFTGFQYLFGMYLDLKGLTLSFSAFAVGTLLSPKFQAMKTKEGEKLFMKWIFLKGIKEIY